MTGPFMIVGTEASIHDCAVVMRRRDDVSSYEYDIVLSVPWIWQSSLHWLRCWCWQSGPRWKKKMERKCFCFERGIECTLVWVMEQLQATIKAVEQSQRCGNAHWADTLCNLHYTTIQTNKNTERTKKNSKLNKLKNIYILNMFPAEMFGETRRGVDARLSPDRTSNTDASNCVFIRVGGDSAVDTFKPSAHRDARSLKNSYRRGTRTEIQVAAAAVTIKYQHLCVTSG